MNRPPRSAARADRDTAGHPTERRPATTAVQRPSRRARRDGAFVAQLDVRLAIPAVAAWVTAAALLPRPWAALPVALAAASAAAVVAGTAIPPRLRLLGTLATGGNARDSGRASTGGNARDSGPHAGLAAVLVCVAAAAATTGLHLRADRPPPLVALADAQRSAQLVLTVTGDPVPLPVAVHGSALRRPLLRVPARVEQVRAASVSFAVRAPVMVFAPPKGWSQLLPGQRVTADGRLGPARPGDTLAGIVLVRGPPLRADPAPVVQRAAGSVRAGMRRAVAPLPAELRGLLPGLVLGDTSDLPVNVVDDFRVTGLTHLVAVSGANLAIIVATVVGVARAVGAWRRLCTLLGLFSIVAFVVVARPSASVLRAGVMGVAVLAGQSGGRRAAGLPVLAAATLVLVMVDPALAGAAGFALSVLATAGIVVMAGPLRDRLAVRWPRWLAEVIAVPVAAQATCGPLLAALFGGLSLVAVPANALAAVAVAPATVLGVTAAAVAPVWLGAAQLVGRAAAVPAGWLLLVAHTAARVPAAQVAVPTGWLGAALVLIVTTVVVAAGRGVVRRPLFRGAAATAATAAVVGGSTGAHLVPGWPPANWAMVACDVGQGDALALNAGSGAAVVVDTGPDPALIDRCLSRLHVHRVPLVVLTHLHADHVEGLSVVLAHRHVGTVEVGPLDEPAAERSRVWREAAAAHVPVQRVVDGERRQVGPLSWQVLAPAHAFSGTDSDPNNSSIMMRVRLPGFIALLTGDVELAAQQELVDSGADLTADVLKVPHHGSNRQLPAFLDRVHERIAVTSVGANNDYGHPAPATMARVAADGARGFRTDRDGSIALLTRDGSVVAVAEHGVGTSPLAPGAQGQPRAADGRDSTAGTLAAAASPATVPTSASAVLVPEGGCAARRLTSRCVQELSNATNARAPPGGGSGRLRAIHHPGAASRSSVVVA